MVPRNKQHSKKSWPEETREKPTSSHLGWNKYCILLLSRTFFLSFFLSLKTKVMTSNNKDLPTLKPYLIPSLPSQRAEVESRERERRRQVSSSNSSKDNTLLLPPPSAIHPASLILPNELPRTQFLPRRWRDWQTNLPQKGTKISSPSLQSRQSHSLTLPSTSPTYFLPHHLISSPCDSRDSAPPKQLPRPS